MLENSWVAERLEASQEGPSSSELTGINGLGDPLRWPRDTLYPQKMALTAPTRGGRSVDIVRLRTNATEFSFSFSATP
jgi:hypothetical protein